MTAVDALKSINTMDGEALANETVNYFSISSLRSLSRAVVAIKKTEWIANSRALADERSTIEKLLASLTNLDILMIVH